MDLDLSPEQNESLEAIRLWATKELPHLAAAAQTEKTELRPLLASFQRMGLTTMRLPEEAGGSGIDPILFCAILESIASIDASAALCLALPNALILESVFSDSERRLPSRLSLDLQLGRKTTTFATESLEHPCFRLQQTGSGIRLEGRASAVPLGPCADLLFLLAQDESHQFFLFALPTGAKELSWTEKSGNLGLRGCPVFGISLAMDILGEESSALGRLSYEELQHLRSCFQTSVASIALGVGYAALSKALTYAKERKQFNQPIAQFQAIQWKLADMSIRLEAASVLTKKASWAWREGEVAAHETTAFHARLLACEAALFASQESIQIHGGYGFLREFFVERFYRDAAALRSRFSAPSAARHAGYR